jgi:hypothetical protein
LKQLQVWLNCTCSWIVLDSASYRLHTCWHKPTWWNIILNGLALLIMFLLIYGLTTLMIITYVYVYIRRFRHHVVEYEPKSSTSSSRYHHSSSVRIFPLLKLHASRWAKIPQEIKYWAKYTIISRKVKTFKIQVKLFIVRFKTDFGVICRHNSTALLMQ